MIEDEAYDRLESLGEWRADNCVLEPWDDSYWDAVLDAADDARKRRREAGIPNPLLPETAPAEIRCGADFGSRWACILPACHSGGHYFRAA